jgi:hypothetical protein
MFFSFSVPVVTQTGRRFPAAIVAVYGTRSGVSVKLYTNETRRVALRIATLLRVDVRSVDYDSDPTPAVDYLLNAVLDVLASRRVRATRNAGNRWPRVSFDRPKVHRWAGWTNRARRNARRSLAAMSNDSPAPTGRKSPRG